MYAWLSLAESPRSKQRSTSFLAFQGVQQLDEGKKHLRSVLVILHDLGFRIISYPLLIFSSLEFLSPYLRPFPSVELLWGSYVCKAGLGDVMLGAAATIADYNGVAKASHIKDRLQRPTGAQLGSVWMAQNLGDVFGGPKLANSKNWKDWKEMNHWVCMSLMMLNMVIFGYVWLPKGRSQNCKLPKISWMILLITGVPIFEWLVCKNWMKQEHIGRCSMFFHGYRLVNVEVMSWPLVMKLRGFHDHYEKHWPLLTSQNLGALVILAYPCPTLDVHDVLDTLDWLDKTHALRKQ